MTSRLDILVVGKILPLTTANYLPPRLTLGDNTHACWWMPALLKSSAHDRFTGCFMTRAMPIRYLLGCALCRMVESRPHDCPNTCSFPFSATAFFMEYGARRDMGDLPVCIFSTTCARVACGPACLHDCLAVTPSVWAGRCAPGKHACRLCSLSLSDRSLDC